MEGRGATGGDHAVSGITSTIRPGVAASLPGNGETLTRKPTGIAEEVTTGHQEARHAGRTEVRAPIAARKRGSACGVKGCREVDA